MLFEEEEDIFSGGSPKKKFFDIVYNANRNLVELELDKMVERICLLEAILEEKIGEEAMESEIAARTFSDTETLETCKMSKYIELTANILTQNE